MNISESLFKQLVWDYQIKRDDFEQILAGTTTQSGLDQNWALTRVLEHAPYYQARKLIPLELLRTKWPELQHRLHRQDIKKGYEFLLHRHAVSATG